MTAEKSSPVVEWLAMKHSVGGCSVALLQHSPSATSFPVCQLRKWREWGQRWMEEWAKLGWEGGGMGS